MTVEHLSHELSPQQRIDMKIGSVLGNTFKQLPQERVWMHTGGSDDNPFSKALTIQPAKYDGTRSYVVLSFFAGPNPPLTDDEWVAKRHMRIRFEYAPRILEALHEEPLPDLPRDLMMREDPDATLRDTEQIAQTAKTIFDRLESPKSILDLAENLEKTKPNTSRILGMDVSDQQALGII